VIKLSFQT
jgi:carbon starvation protein CstA